MVPGSDENVCEEGIFNQLFKTHSTDLFRFLYYKFGGDNNPADLVQEAFVALWENCHKVPRSKAKSYLFTVANNQMLNVLARNKTVLKYQQEKPRSYTAESPDYIMEGNEYMSILQAAIQDLSEEQRVTFLLNRIEGKKHKEIAEMLGISQKTVEKRIYTAVAIISEKIGKI